MQLSPFLALLVMVGICRIDPIVLGTIPKPCKGHSAIALNEDRILFINGGSTLDDSIWILEVSHM